ncbi:MAG: protein kinase, partial [Polyangiaceae bacterium]|nr:protein kinase [Polyangiaceae bacterium]
VVDGKYRLERVLGEGGMGVVVQAYHLDLEKRVALKFMWGKKSQDAESVARFLREAKAAARLQSEHVARVLDVGRLPGGEPYMVMELLKGQDLCNLVEHHGPLAPDRAVSYVLQACSAIAEAHAAGIVHRDLKPSNLFLAECSDGRRIVKVLDFGISKMSSADAAAMTNTRDVLGSPAYMSPEQIQSARNVDGRTDIWSLGMILYNLATGTIAYSADNVAGVLTSVLTEAPVPVRDRRPELSEPLAAVIMQCLSKNPAKRPKSVAALARELAPFAPPEERAIASRVADLLGAVDISKLDGRVSSGKRRPAVCLVGVFGTSAAQPESPRPNPRSMALTAGAGLVLVAVALATGAVVASRGSSAPQPLPEPLVGDTALDAALALTQRASSSQAPRFPGAKPVGRDAGDAQPADELPASVNPPPCEAEPAQSKPERHGASPCAVPRSATTNPPTTKKSRTTAKPPAASRPQSPATPPPAKKNPLDISIK